MKKILTLVLVIFFIPACAQFVEPQLVGVSSGPVGWIRAIDNYVGSDTLDVYTTAGVFTVSPDVVSDAFPMGNCINLSSQPFPPYHLDSDQFADGYCLEFSSSGSELWALIEIYRGCPSLDCLFESSYESFLVTEAMNGSSMAYHDFYDLDNDGDQDLIVTIEENELSNFFSMIIFENNNLDFNKVAEVPICENCGKQYRQMRYADMDGDGLLDILPFAYGSYSLSYIKQTALMSFDDFDPVFLSDTILGELSGSIYQSIPQIQDVNADGLPEIVYYQSTGTWLSPAAVFENLGDFNFSLFYDSLQYMQVGQGMFNADFDQDGDVDELIYFNSLESSPLYYKRKEESGLSTFFLIDSEVYDVKNSDYDFDGDIDAFYSKGNQLYLLENTGVSMVPDAAFIKIIPFADINSNYIWDVNETEVFTNTLLNESMLTFNIGENYLVIPPGTYEINALSPSSYWLGYDTLLILYPEDSLTIRMPIQPSSLTVNVEVEQIISPNPCGSQSQMVLHIFNSGVTELNDVMVAFELDPLYSFVDRTRCDGLYTWISFG